MGFGTLLFGYFAMYAFSVSPYYFFADIIGAFAAVYALTKMADYSRYFGFAMFGALGFLVVSGVNAVSLLFELYPMGEGPVWTVAEILKLAAGCAMHVWLFLGIRVVAERAGQDRLKKKGLRNLVATSLYYAAAALAVILFPFLADTVGQAVSAGILLYWAVCFFMNLLLIYGCFSSIVPADTDLSVKPRSKIGFLNKMSDKFDELDDKRNEYRRESMKLAMEEANRLHAEREKKKKKKHRK